VEGLARWLATARDWVSAVERAYVAAAFSPAPGAGLEGADAELAPVAAAAAGAIASRFLAVGTPRSIGLVGEHPAAALSLAAHRVWFQPTDLRCAGAPLAAALGGRAASLEEALAADIVCLHAPIPLAAVRLRRGTHVNALAGATLDDDLRALAAITDEPAGLPALAAGLRDGRQLDELTIFLAGDLAVARRAFAALR
jgi:hypothetical protein